MLLRFSTILAAVLFLLVGCRPTMVTQENAQGFDYVIVEGDQSFEVTMAQLYNELKGSKLFPGGGIVEPDSIEIVLDSIVLDTLDGFEAAFVDLESNYELHRQYKSRYRDALIAGYLDKFVYGKVEIDSQAVADFYFSRPDLFTLPERVFVYHILIAAKGLRYGPDSLLYEDMTRPEVEAEAEKVSREIRSMIDSPESFKEIAAQYSHDTTARSSGGLVGWAERGLYLHPFDSVAFAMKPGDISDPYEDSYGWHIVMVEDYQAEGMPPLNAQTYLAAAENYRIAQANIIGASLMDTLMDGIEVRFNETLMDTNLYFVDIREWVAIVNGQDTIECNDARGPELKMRNQYQVANTTAEQKRFMLLELARKYKLIQAARATGIDTLPEIVSERRGLWHKYSKTIVKRSYAIDPYWRAPDSVVESYYNEHFAEFNPAKPMKVQHIIVQDSLFADFLRDQAMSGYEFLDLAEEYFSADKADRRKLADLGDIGENDVSNEFWERARQTVLGEVSHPVRTEQGFHIIKVLERRDAKSLGQAGPDIQQLMKEIRRQDLIRDHYESLKKKYNVKFKGKIVPVHLEPLAMRTPFEW
ncbi:MAG: peptidylprolyl isomerase [Candidatus Zixiibacteriota bacterium]|nr:MAG: peptidylprolyl isomerase [candidate division Zixibacteria bacterium]